MKNAEGWKFIQQVQATKGKGYAMFLLDYAGVAIDVVELKRSWHWVKARKLMKALAHDVAIICELNQWDAKEATENANKLLSISLAAYPEGGAQ